MRILIAFPAILASVHAAKTAPAPDPAASSAALGREAVQLLASQAESPDYAVRALAAAAWGELGNRGAVPLLKKMLADDKPDVRIAAASALRKLGDVQGLTALIDETKPLQYGEAKSPAEELRRMGRDAARARATLKLGEVGGETAVAALRSALKDPAGVVRDAAAVALARLGAGDAAPFVAALKDTDEGVRASAAKSLGLIGKTGADELRRLAATDPSASVRAEAAGALGAFSDPASAQALAAALSDKSARVRLSAAKALSRSREAGSTPALKALFEQAPPAELALVVGAALAARGDESALELAELTLGQNDPELKASAVETLGHCRQEKAVQLLAKVMREDAEPRLRAQAASALIARLRTRGAR